MLNQVVVVRGTFVFRCFFWLVVLLTIQTTCLASDSKPLKIVTDSWPPFAIEESSHSAGMDFEIVQAVMEKLGLPFHLQFYPWNRAVEMVRHQKVDAILSISRTPERQTFLHFPEEPVSTAETVFFIDKKRLETFPDFSALHGKRVGAMLGYHYCEELDSLPLIQNAYRSSDLAQNFNLLMAGRLDAVVEAEAVGNYMINTLGLSEQVVMVPRARFCRGGNYLAFSRLLGNERLAQSFAEALAAFKQTEAYQEILQRYGG